jgi:Mn-dependent DtxR family transcriptional regulator
MVITPRQKEYIDAIAWFFTNNDQFPPCVTLADIVGATPNAACEMMLRLERKGIVSKNDVDKYKRGPEWMRAIAMVSERAQKTRRSGLVA